MRDGALEAGAVGCEIDGEGAVVWTERWLNVCGVGCVISTLFICADIA